MILCCGEALIDMLPRRLAGGEDVFLPVPGGAAFNTAIALGRLGQDVGLFSGISTDMFGQQLLSRLHESMVDTGNVVASDRPTTLAFVRLREGVAEYSFFDENSAGKHLHADQLPEPAKPVDALLFGGISLISEPCGTAYEALALDYSNRAVIMFDPNIRPGFVSDETAYRDRLKRLLRIGSVIKVSDEDLAWLAPGQSFDSVASRWISDGAVLVVLTRGAAGCRARTRSLDVEMAADQVTVVDSVGAGDAFNAGLLAALRQTGHLCIDKIADLDRTTLSEALGFASKVAARTLGRIGADPPWKSEI